MDVSVASPSGSAAPEDGRRDMGDAGTSGFCTDPSIRLAGVGSFVPDQRVTNQTILDRVRPARPDGRRLEPEWIERHIGIRERRLDFDFTTHRKRSRAEGGLYDGDLAARAARASLDDAGVAGRDVDVLVHVTSTPDTLACQDHFRFLVDELGLRRDTDLVHHNLGCAGLAAGFRTAASYLAARTATTALVIASNCPSGYFAAEANPHYASHPSGLGWLVPLVFADGAGSAVLRAAPSRDDRPRGLCSVRYETHPDTELVTYPAGGCLNRTSAANVGDHLFLMDGKRVAQVFAPLMQRNMQMLEDDWPTTVKPITGTDFDVEAVARWYLHQANGLVVRQAADLLGLPEDRVPINVDRYGNTSAASTLLLLDEDRRAGRVGDGDLVVFMWIGAGNGAMNGYAALVL
jgi:3-oxoacyl-[acyl-carrier-protein] synthase-3